MRYVAVEETSDMGSKTPPEMDPSRLNTRFERNAFRRRPIRDPIRDSIAHNSLRLNIAILIVCILILIAVVYVYYKFFLLLFH